MELVKLGKKGQVTIPRTVLKQIGIEDETPLLVETTDEGAIVLRQAGVYPLELYSDERVREFEETNRISADLERRVQQWLSGEQR